FPQSASTTFRGGVPRYGPTRSERTWGILGACFLHSYHPNDSVTRGRMRPLLFQHPSHLTDASIAAMRAPRLSQGRRAVRRTPRLHLRGRLAPVSSFSSRRCPGIFLRPARFNARATDLKTHAFVVHYFIADGLRSPRWAHTSMWVYLDLPDLI